MIGLAELVARFAGSPLVAASALGDPDAVSVVLGEGTERLDIVVTRVGGHLAAYANACPHAWTPLETFDGRFLDRDDAGILVCSTHGARFRQRDGYCIAGPCSGKRLIPVPVVVADGTIAIAGGDRL